jgi:hypothetical protein
VIQPEIEPADQGQTLIAIEWAIDSSSRLIASWAPVFGRSSTVSQDEIVLFALRTPPAIALCGAVVRPRPWPPHTRSSQ